MKRKLSYKRYRDDSDRSTDSDSGSDLRDFVVDDDIGSDEIDNLSDGIIQNNPKYHRICEEIKKSEISIETILNLNLTMDDSIWFIEHIRMMNAMMDKTEEKYNMKRKVYEKYKQVTSSEYEKLKNIKSNSNVLEDITTRIVNSGHTDEVKALLYRKYSRALDSASTDEYFKAIEWIDCVLDMPTDVHSNFYDLTLQERLNRFWSCINTRVYGLDQVKEKVMESLCSIMLNEKHSGKIITLVGPPGVGKTLIASAVAEAMDIPFNQISMNNINDPSVLVGHSSTYIGSRPGVFVNILRKTKRSDSLILLDEVDKIPCTEEGNNIAYKLLQILDKSQNFRFNDCYMPEIDLDLSKILFFLTANDVSRIPEPLKDRLIIINITGYTYDDKINIAEQHIFPRTINMLGFNKASIKYDCKSIAYLINKIEITPGVRNLERAVEQLMERLSLIINTKNSDIKLSYFMKLSLPIKIDKRIIDALIECQKN